MHVSAGGSFDLRGILMGEFVVNFFILILTKINIVFRM